MSFIQENLGNIVRLYTSLLPPRLGVKVEYFRKFKRLPDLNSPKTFTEKIAWRKLYQQDRRHVNWSDKLYSKEKVSEMFGSNYCLENFWVGSNPENIPFESLIPPYVIKTNNGSHDQTFVRDKNYNKESIVSYYKTVFKRKFGYKTHEYQYTKIVPKIFVEPMMLCANNQPPIDYKFHIFSGSVEFIQVDLDRFQGQKRAIYSKTWDRLPFSLLYPNYEGEVEKPTCFDDMLRMAEKIGSQFDYARVDFYEYEGRAIFGEVSFTHGAGYEKFLPEHYDSVYGKKWIHAETSQIKRDT